MFRRIETYTIKEFMNREHQSKDKEKKERRKANKAAVTSVVSIPLMAFTPKMVAAASCAAVPVMTTTQAVPVGAGAVVGKELIAGLAHIFDPLIQLLIGVSFPVASALILFKLFMGFFVDQGQVWEGIGKVALVYILIQMFPVFSGILKQLGTLV